MHRFQESPRGPLSISVLFVVHDCLIKNHWFFCFCFVFVLRWTESKGSLYEINYILK